MRTLARNEMLQRGCEFCLDHRSNGREGTGCIHAVCPYHELDNVKTYREYEKTLTGEDIVGHYLKKICEVSEKCGVCQKNGVDVR